MTTTWQHPYVNIFKSFKLAQNGPKLVKKGDVQSRSEKLVKSIVYTITGQVPANAYLQFPAKSQESLDLVGRFFYITFKPLPQAYFTFHLDILTDDTRQSVRISISNLFKEYKSSNTWLQFPVVVDSAPGTPDHTTQSLRIPDGRKSPDKPAWSMLCLDLKSILAVHLNRQYGCLKSLRICANLTVRNCFTSDVEFCPTISPTQARQCGILKMNEQYSPMPREMNFPMDIKSENCGEDWDKNYVYLRYPNTRIPGPFNIIRRANLTAVEYFGKENMMPGVPFVDGKAVEKDAARPGSNIFNQTSPKKRSKTKEDKVECRITELPEFNLGNSDNLENNHKVEASGCLAGDTHVFFDDTKLKDSQTLVDSEFSSDINLKKVNSGSTGTNSGNNSTFDVKMKTQSVFGFSTYTKKRNCNQTAIHPNGVDYFYAAGNSIIRMRNTEQIEILTGHSGPVVALTINSIGTLLISAQANPGESYSIIRVWSIDFLKNCTSCISMSRIPHTDLSFLVLSESGDYLAGVGNLKSGVQYLLVWDVSAVQSNGDISIFAKATIHAGSSGNVEGVCFVNNDRRLVTYGGYQKVDNQNGSCLKLWELRSGSISWTGIDVTQTPELYEPSGNDGFTTRYSEMGLTITGAQESEGLLYCCFKGGYLLVIDTKGVSDADENTVFQKNVIKIRERHMLDPVGKINHKSNLNSKNRVVQVPLSCLSIAENYFALGGADGILRLISRCDKTRGSVFGEIILEAEHDAGIHDIKIAPNGKWLLASTETSLGKLDVTKRVYENLARGHLNSIIWLTIDSIRRRVVTIGKDQTIRVWCLDTRQQLFDFKCEDENDQPVCSDVHFNESLLLVGFASGMIRCFRLSDQATGLEFELPISNTKQTVLSLKFTPTTDDLHLNYRYLALSERELTLWSRDDIIRTVPNASYYINSGTRTFLQISQDSRFAVIRSKKSALSLYRPTTLDLCFKIDIKTTDSCPIDVCFGPAPCNLLHVLTDKNKLLTFWIGVRINAFEKLQLEKKPQIGQLMREIDMKVPSVISNIVLSECGKVLFTSCRDTIRVYDLNDDEGRILSKSLECETPSYKEFYNAGKVGTLGILMDKKTLVSTSDGVVSVYDYSVSGENYKIPVANVDSDDEEYQRSELNFDEEFGQRPSLKPMPKFGSGIGNLGQNVDLNLSLDDYDPLVSKPSTNDLIEQLNQNPKPLVFSRTKTSSPTQLLSDRLILEKTHFSKEPALELANTIGFNGLKGRRNVTWAARAGFLVYETSCFIVKEDINDGEQIIYRKSHSQMVANNRPINSICLKNDGRFLALSLESQGVHKPQLEIIALELDPNSPIKVLSHNHRKDIVTMCFSRDDRFLFTVSDDRVVVWSSYDWSMIQQAVQTSTDDDQLCVQVVADHCSAERFAIAWQNKIEIYYLDEEERKLKRLVLVAPGRMRRGTSAGLNKFTSVAFNTWQDNSERVIFASLASGTVICWKINDGKQVAHFPAAETEITQIATSHEINSKLVVTTIEGNVRIWDISALINGDSSPNSNPNALENVTVVYDTILPSPVTSIVVDKELSLGIVGVENGTIHYIDFRNQEDNTRLVSGGAGDEVIIMDTIKHEHEENTILVTGHVSGNVRVWNLEERELLTNFEIVENYGNSRNSSTESCTAVKCLSSQDDENGDDYLNDYIAAGYSKGTLRIFDLNKSELAIRVSPFNTSITALELGLDATLWVGCKNGVIALVSLTSGLTQRLLTDHKPAPIDLISGVYNNLTGVQMMVCGARDSRFSVWESNLENDNSNLIDWVSVATPPNYPDGQCFETRNLKNDETSQTSNSTLRSKSSKMSNSTKITKSSHSHTKTSMSSISRSNNTLHSNTSKMSQNESISGTTTIIDWSKIPKCLLKVTGGSSSDAPHLGIFTCYSLNKEVVVYSFSQKQILRTIKIGHWASDMVICGSNYVVLAVNGGLLEVVDVTSGHIHDISAHTSKVVSLVGVRGGSVLSASDSGELLIWKTADRRRNKEEKQVGFI